MNLDFNRRLSIAPMLDCTDRHERFFLRLLSKETLLYSEMITTHALLHNPPDKFLTYQDKEHPVALQLGGASPKDLGECAKIVEKYGYDEINLNCGCPSERVQNGSFGACLMKEKKLVADCFKAMSDVVSIPISIKCRIGVDNLDSWNFFKEFIDEIANAGCKIFIIHARKAWLKGLSPKENREIPPLNYDYVYQLKREMKNLNISLNGGVKTIEQIKGHLKNVDGVMVGREAYDNPWFLWNADKEIFQLTRNTGDNPKEIYRGEALPASRKILLKAYMLYMEEELTKGTPPTILTRHLYGLFNGCKGARKYRQTLSEEISKTHNALKVLEKAISFIEE